MLEKPQLPPGAIAQFRAPDSLRPGQIASQRALTIAAIGVVFGDIGTSPLYAFRECVHGPHGVAPRPENVLGVLSLIFWALMLVVTVKYIGFIMRAHNQGEGGILALLALLPRKLRLRPPGKVGIAGILVIFGAGLLYGDGIITPAISVLSATEGLAVATDKLQPFVLPISLVIIVALFAIQSHGAGGLGRLFGPIMVVWFLTIGLLGAWHLANNPTILVAADPRNAIELFQRDGWHSFRLLGGVVLVVTGAEALYADMGHFGARPIQRAWLGLVFPALLLAYFGQGALILANPEAAANPFYAMVPRGVPTYLLVVLATAAAVIASQALISGAFSLTHQAVQLGYFPRVTVRHTAREHEGQIYVPEINWLMAIICIGLVLAFQSSSRLASAYGVAVTGTMVITSMMFFLVAWKTWKWPLVPSLFMLLCFLATDLPFFVANTLKFKDGGYVPIVIALMFFGVMVTWRIGRSLLGEYIANKSMPWPKFLAGLDEMLFCRTAGTAVFMASPGAGVPPAMVHHARMIKVLPERVLVATVIFHHVPYVGRQNHLEVQELGGGFWSLTVHFGFMQQPQAPEIVAEALQRLNFPERADEVVYYLGRETLLATNKGKMGRWSETLFSFLAKNAKTATSYFGVPPEQVVELGTQIDL